jgi:hypothetical protein
MKYKEKINLTVNNFTTVNLYLRSTITNYRPSLSSFCYNTERKLWHTPDMLMEERKEQADFVLNWCEFHGFLT